MKLRLPNFRGAEILVGVLLTLIVTSALGVRTLLQRSEPPPAVASTPTLTPSTAGEQSAWFKLFLARLEAGRSVEDAEQDADAAFYALAIRTPATAAENETR